eukprot:TRINITY_DN6799_c0_g1_i1.p1 TRINITY_DN6799_c0_g1~~TRINITY_DN6799_c0_g1_i1.p1  ORF type:complete len:493 (-),score=101.55 TRINITY_DN6799_c0_g1_i1:334-1758(-)
MKDAGYFNRIMAHNPFKGGSPNGYLIFPEVADVTEKLRLYLGISEDFKLIPATQEEVNEAVSAVRANNITRLKRLVARGVTANMKDEYGKTILHEAAMTLNYAVLRYLFEETDMPLDPNIGDDRLAHKDDRTGFTALHWICSYARGDHLQQATESVKILCKDPRIQVNTKDNKGNTPLVVASSIGAVQIMEILVEQGANLNLATLGGSTALHAACALGQTEAAEFLLDAAAWIEVEDSKGMRPIHLAAKGGHLDIVRLLQEHEASMNPKTRSGQTPKDLTNDENIHYVLDNMFTSVSHPIEVDFVKSPEVPVLGNCRIGMSMCPGRNKKNWRRDLPTDIAVLTSCNIDITITTVTTDELVMMKIPHYFDALHDVGIETVHFPIKDKWLPKSQEEFMGLIEQMVEFVRQERVIHVHCNGGKGRTGLVVVATLVALGMEPGPAVDRVREARSGMIRNPAQLAYVRVFQKKWKELHG